MNPTTKLAFYDRLLAALRAAQEVRHLRGACVDTDDGPEFGWVVYERETMLNVVNQLRAGLNLPAATMTHVQDCESMAAGHSDYTTKFALYCAELAVGER